MKLAIFKLTLALGFIFLGSSWALAYSQRAGEYLLTFYAQPERPRTGSFWLGLRTQNRDYQIVIPTAIKIIWIGPTFGVGQKLAMHRGLGLDFRTRVTALQPGNYQLKAHVKLAEGKVLETSWKIAVGRKLQPKF